MATRVAGKARRELRSGVAPARRSVAARRLSAMGASAKVQLGSGTNYLPGWVNIDVDRFAQPDIVHDLTLGLPAPAGSIRLLYSEHVLEHLPLAAGQRLLSDCRIALAGGGVMRTAMPDLRAVVAAYLGDWRDQPWLADNRFPDIDTAAHMFNVSMREWGHQYLYDEADLRLRLTEAGFADVRTCAWGESSHHELIGLETRPDSHLIIEATAP